MNLSSKIAEFRLDFEKKRNSRGLEEKIISRCKNGCLILGSHNRADHDHEKIMNNDLNDYSMKEEKEDMLMITSIISKRSNLDLLQNCDLPPPLKVFPAGVDKNVLNSARFSPYRPELCGEDESNKAKEPLGVKKLELLRALQLSQTRAREAEKKTKLMNQEKDHLSNLLLKESLRVFTYGQWVKLLEFEVLLVNLRKEKEQPKYPFEKEKRSTLEEEKEEEEDGDSLTWCMALALCFGIVGAGFVLSCRYYYLF